MLRGAGLLERTAKGYKYRGLAGFHKLQAECRHMAEEKMIEEKTTSHGSVTPSVTAPRLFKPRVLLVADGYLGEPTTTTITKLAGKRENAEEGVKGVRRILELGKTEGAFKRFSMELVSGAKVTCS